MQGVGNFCEENKKNKKEKVKIMNIDYNNLFEGIKESLKQERAQAKNRIDFDKIIKLERPKGGQTVNEYMFRILPYIKEGKEGLHKTFFFYAKYFWQDELGTYHGVLSRKTFGEKCAISDYYYNVLRNGSDYEKENLERNLKYRQGWYCNVYVVHDPINPSNNGKVMVLSLNKTLWMKVQAALNGELDDEWSTRMTDANPTGEEIHVNVGRMVTDLTNNGVNFNVRITSKGQYPDYSSSDFTRRDARLNLTEQQQDEILNSCIDVSKIEREVTAEEALKTFKENFLGQKPIYQSAHVEPAVESVQKSATQSIDDMLGNDQIPMGPASTTNAESHASNVEANMDDFINSLSSKNSNQAGSFNFN